MAYILGIDLGGTKVEAAIFDGEGKILGRHRTKTEAWRSEEEVFERIAGVAAQAITNSQIEPYQVAALGIGTPGPLDPQTGYIIETANLPFKNFPLGPRLSERFNCPFAMANDVDAGTYGEYKAGAAQGASIVLGVFVGTGIGGGIIMHNEIYGGFNKNAAEIGHVVIRAEGPPDKRGVPGTLEYYTSRTGITRTLKEAIKKGKKSKISKKIDKKNGAISSGDIRACYDAGDALVKKVVDRAAKYLGLAIGGYVNVMSPELIVMGGGVVEAMGEPFVKRIEKYAHKVAFSFSMNGVRIVQAKLGDDAGITGAAMLAKELLSKQSAQEMPLAGHAG
jgi:glucokinase